MSYKKNGAAAPGRSFGAAPWVWGQLKERGGGSGEKLCCRPVGVGAIIQLRTAHDIFRKLLYTLR